MPAWTDEQWAQWEASEHAALTAARDRPGPWWDQVLAAVFYLATPLALAATLLVLVRA